MAKKKNNKKQSKKSKLDKTEYPDIPDEAKEKLEQIKDKLEKFKDTILERFSEYVLGVALLPPSKDEEKKEKINVLLLIDDTDSTKMTKDELREKLGTIMGQVAESIDPALNPEVLLLTELWQNCYDSKYELLQVIANSAPIYDKGMLAALKISEIHKTMVLKKFEKYIVSYVLAGSLVQGKATSESDIDVFIVIDDTDVKKMTRAELKDKLRAIIIGMGIDAGKMTGIENKINIQVYILTDFWENIKEANPVIFTFLRDGIPLYDRGIFMPWKQLLQMGRVKPSPESIDMFMHSGDQMLERVKIKLKEIGMEEFFWAAITTSQAALMLYGIPPPTPKETPEVLRHIFVKKEKILDEKNVKIVERILKIRKDMEHGSKKEITGKEIDELYTGTSEFLERMKKLFEEIQSLKEKDEFTKAYDDVITAARHALELEGVSDVKDADLEKTMRKNLVDKGKLSASNLRDLIELNKSKKQYDSGKISRAEVNKIATSARSLLRSLVEHIQRVRGRELEKAKLRIKHGDKYGEVILLKEKAFIIRNVDEPEKEIQVASIDKEGGLTQIKNSNYQELEAALMDTKFEKMRYISDDFFGNLKEIFGKDMKILVNY